MCPSAALAIPAAVVSAGGACLLCRPPTPPSLSLTAPIPPAPLPGGKGENQSYFMQGASPLASPGAEPERRLLSLPLWKTQWGLVLFAACQPCLEFTLSPPIPPAPFPDGEGGDYRLILPGASPPAPRALNRLRHLQSLPCGHPAHGRLRFGAKPTEVLS